MKSLAALGGSSGLFGHDLRPAAAEAPIETTKIRLVHAPSVCLAPQYLAEALLRLEGADLTMEGATALVPALDGGRSLLALSGVHGGCYEHFDNLQVQAIRDLEGKHVAMTTLGGAGHVYIASMMAYVGVDPRTDVKWVATKTFDGPMHCARYRLALLERVEEGVEGVSGTRRSRPHTTQRQCK